MSSALDDVIGLPYVNIRATPINVPANTKLHPMRIQFALLLLLLNRTAVMIASSAFTQIIINMMIIALFTSISSVKAEYGYGVSFLRVAKSTVIII